MGNRIAAYRAGKLSKKGLQRRPRSSPAAVYERPRPQSGLLRASRRRPAWCEPPKVTQTSHETKHGTRERAGKRRKDSKAARSATRSLCTYAGTSQESRKRLQDAQNRPQPPKIEAPGAQIGRPGIRLVRRTLSKGLGSQKIANHDPLLIAAYYRE